MPSRAISSALVLLDHDPGALAVLEARRRRADPAAAFAGLSREPGAPPLAGDEVVPVG